MFHSSTSQRLTNARRAVLREAAKALHRHNCARASPLACCRLSRRVLPTQLRVLPTPLSRPWGTGTTGQVCSAGKGQPPRAPLRWSHRVSWGSLLSDQGSSVFLCLAPPCHLPSPLQVSGPGSERVPGCAPRSSSAGVCPPRSPPTVHCTTAYTWRAGAHQLHFFCSISEL